MCGDFLEFSRATTAVKAAQTFWEDLGLLPGWHGEDPHPWVRLIRDDINLAFHLTGPMKPGLTFFADDMDARIEYLRASGYKIEPRTPLPSGATLTAPEGTPLYLYPGQDYAGAVDFS